MSDTIIEETVTGQDRAKALKIKRKDGTEQTIVMKGAFSELFYRVLNILYKKDSKYAGNYSLESGGAEVLALHAIDARVINADTIADFVEFALVMKGANRNCVVAIGFESEANPGQTQLIRDLAVRYGVAIAEPVSLAKALANVRKD